MISYVIKRDGAKSEFDPDKLNRWAIWAQENCGVAWSPVALRTVRKLYDGVSTEDLQLELIKTCIEFRTEGHSKMAARLLVGLIYKEAYGSTTPPSFSEHYARMVEMGSWSDMNVNSEILSIIDTIIDHSIDFTYGYPTVKQFYDKYCQKKDGVALESPQMALMALAVSNTNTEHYADEKVRVEAIRSFYNDLCGLLINLPTPTLSMERTESLPQPSCCLISAKDTVDSIGAAAHVAYTMTARSAGIGMEIETRAPLDPVKNGTIQHGGKYGYYALIDRAVKANQQKTRGGSATVNIHNLDPEIGDLLTMRSQRTDTSYRLDHMDYVFCVNDLFLEKAAKNEDWMTVSNIRAPQLWELSFSGDVEAFRAEYERVLADDSIQKKLVPARNLLLTWFTGRGDHGRNYLLFLDNVNRYKPFKDPIRMTNLCTETILPTRGANSLGDLYKPYEEGDMEIALCHLAAIVTPRITSDEEYERVAYTTCSIIDNTIDRTDYDWGNLEHTATKRRSIGVGIVGLAYELASRGLTYDSREGLSQIHVLAERHSYFLHKASVRLAKERGACEWYHKTKYADGWLPVDDMNTFVDQFHDAELRYDWEALRKDIAKYGMRFSVLECHQPTESSSVFSNMTNGLYPVRDLEVYKSSKKGHVYFRAPDMDTLKYQNAFEIDDIAMVHVYSIVQKFTGQGISADFYSITDGDKNRLSFKKMMQRVLMAAKCGMKTFYYENFSTMQAVADMKSGEDVRELVSEGCEDCKM